ncbi:MAG: hypothetical protein LLG04_11845 [Parachlamydia sp.]|nr:hypothetical protein [Parachlamydia sp.]
MLTFILNDLQSYGCESHLIRLIDIVARIKTSLINPPDEESRAALKQMLPQCKQALCEKMKFFKPLPANARLKELQKQNARMQALQIKFCEQIDSLDAELSKVPVATKPVMSSRAKSDTGQEAPGPAIGSGSAVKKSRHDIVSYLNSLPAELLDGCIRHLPLSSLFRMRRVSSKMKETDL